MPLKRILRMGELTYRLRWKVNIHHNTTHTSFECTAHVEKIIKYSCALFEFLLCVHVIYTVGLSL